MAGVCINKLLLLAHVLKVLSAAAVNTIFPVSSAVVCLYVLLLILTVYHHILTSKFVLLADHFTKNNSNISFLFSVLPSHDSSFQV